MLPSILHEDFRSLNPGLDRLAFSVVFMLDAEGNVLDKWFGRSVIESCAKLAYKDAQEIIDRVSQEHESDNFAEIYENRSVSNVAAIPDLFNVSRILRKRRVENVALILDIRKLDIVLDKLSSGLLGAILEKSDSAKYLVEQFMLSASIAVACKICEAYPRTALLHCHAEPKESFLKKMDGRFLLSQQSVKRKPEMQADRVLRAAKNVEYLELCRIFTPRGLLEEFEGRYKNPRRQESRSELWLKAVEQNSSFAQCLQDKGIPKKRVGAIATSLYAIMSKRVHDKFPKLGVNAAGEVEITVENLTSEELKLFRCVAAETKLNVVYKKHKI